MLHLIKKLFGIASSAPAVEAPYKVETPVSVPLITQPLSTTNLLYIPEVSPVMEAAPVAAVAPAQADKKAATGTAKSTAKKSTETGTKPARRRRKPTAT